MRGKRVGRHLKKGALGGRWARRGTTFQGYGTGKAPPPLPSPRPHQVQGGQIHIRRRGARQTQRGQEAGGAAHHHAFPLQCCREGGGLVDLSTLRCGHAVNIRVMARWRPSQDDPHAIQRPASTRHPGGGAFSNVLAPVCKKLSIPENFASDIAEAVGSFAGG